jgi:hypothetical protein
MSAFGAEHGGGMGGEFLSSFSEKISGLGGKAGPIGAALVGVAGIGLAAGAMIASALTEGMEREQSINLIQAKLGTTPEVAGRIGRAAADAYMGNFGNSVDENMESIRLAIQSGLLTGEESQPVFQKTAEQLSTISTLLDTEVSESVQAVSALMSNGLAPNAERAFDLIAKAGQGTANKQGDLIDSIKEYSSGWANAGLSAEMSLALIQQSTENGADNSDRAADSLREFGRRVTEEGDTIVEAIDNIGLSGQDMYDAFKRGGPDAEAAFDAVFDKIRSIEDPVLRNKAAMSLLGDTAGDFIGSLSQWDPSTAVKAFGDVEGAAQTASDTIGQGGASAAETMRRTWEEATMGVKVALAEAFGPQMTDMTANLMANKDELVAFFADVLSAALMFGEGIVRVAQGGLEAYALLAEGAAVWLSSMTQGLATGADALGAFISAIPGMESVGEKISGVGNFIADLDEKLMGSADSARGMSDTLGETVIPVLQEMRGAVDSAGESARLAAQGMDILTGSVISIPNEATVIISDNSPEAKARLEDLGFIVNTLPDGRVEVIAGTDDAQIRLNDFIAANDQKTITMNVRTQALNPIPGVTVPQAGGGRSYDGTIVGGLAAPRAEGGIDNLPGSARIQRRQLIQWAEPETGGEAFIPMAPAKRGRSTSILSEVAGKFGYELLKMADGGITAQDLVARSQSIEGAEYVFGGWDGTWNTDCTGAASRLANMAVYGDPDTGGRFATGNAREALSARGFAEGFREGALNIGWYNDPGGPGGGHAASTLPDGTNVEMGGARGDGQFGGGAAGAQDFANIMHYAVQGNPAPSELDSPSAPAVGGQPSDSSGASYATTDSTSEDSTDGQRVFVTNWPDGSSAEPSDGPKPRAIATATFFANGGVENHTAQIAGAGAMRVWAEPETGGEAYIPLGLAKRARSRAIWRETGRHLGIQQFAEGGFGGYSGPDTTDYMKPRNLYEAASLATGLGFTAASVFGSYLDMASSGTVDLSKLSPQFDTSSNSIPGADKAFQQMTQQLEGILETLKKGGLVKVDADVNTSTGAVGIKFDAAGIA